MLKRWWWNKKKKKKSNSTLFHKVFVRKIFEVGRLDVHLVCVNNWHQDWCVFACVSPRNCASAEKDIQRAELQRYLSSL